MNTDLSSTGGVRCSVVSDDDEADDDNAHMFHCFRHNWFANGHRGLLVRYVPRNRSQVDMLSPCLKALAVDG